MKISPEKFERLLRFLDAEMDPEEIAAFEEELKTDPDLRDQLDFQLKLSEAFSEKKPEEAGYIDSNENLRSILTAAKNKFFKQNDEPVSITGAAKDHHKHIIQVNFATWLAAASVIVLALIAALVYYSGKNSETQDIAINDSSRIKQDQKQIEIIPVDTVKNLPNHSPVKTDYASLARECYTKDPGPADPPLLLAEEIGDYNKGDYQTIQAFDLNNIPKTRGQVNEFELKELGHYYKGLSFIETKNNQQARLNLQWVIDSAKNNLLQIKASWYLSLLYLLKDDVKKSEVLLNHVASNKTEAMYKQKAAGLLGQLKRPG